MIDRRNRRAVRRRFMAEPITPAQTSWQIARQLVSELVVALFTFGAICYVVFVAAPVLAQRLGL